MKANPPTRLPGRGPAWVAGCGLLLLLAVSYHNSLRGPFVLDDGPAIVHNPSIRQLWPLSGVIFPHLEDGGVTVSGRPLVNLSLAVNHALGGEAVIGYHLFNLAVHGLAGLVLFGIVRRTLVGRPGGEGGNPTGGVARAPGGSKLLPEHAWGVAFFVAAIWLVHPLQTAAVTYIVQRAEAMMGLCYLLALYGFIRAVEKLETGNRKPETGGRRNWLLLSVGACLAGMACKEVMVTAPLMILLYDRTFVAGGFRAAWQRRWRYYLGLGGTWLVLAALVAGTAGRGGTAGFGIEVSPWEYALTQCQAIVHYLRLVVWPHPLVFDYGIATVESLGAVWGQALFLVGLLGVTIFALWRRPVLGFIGAWFFALLAPSSSIVPVVTQTMAEHRMYLALVAPVLVVAGGLVAALGRRAWPVLGLLAGLAGGVTYARNADYATAEGLWADTVAKRPANARAHHNLGLAEQARGRLDEAERHLRAAIALAPGSPEPLYNLALVLTRQERRDEAIATYREALRVGPDHAATHNNLANLLRAAGQAEEAGRLYAEAVRLQPGFAGARNSYGNWLIDANRPAEALVQLEEAIRLQPEAAEMQFNAGNACAALGRIEAAADHYRAAIRLEPGHAEARNNLGNVLLEADRPGEAMEQFAEAVRLQPAYFEPRRTLALLLLMHLNRPAEARPHLEVLAGLRPGDREIAEALARARAARP
ncbi:TPR repeat-containing protein YrrB [Lacunisphaera limnophila]|uniref:TPR repeat-containing protein YrrB n=1 Tax=Lacunisphaera limnophila TaxID=1838286 RepID=A0A1I7PHT7_9BACT|nr:tetratricopeptide repeat protein [Lacunisphaera limnophila]AOS43181.1 TPR repeat-containing protein YrrB [Lacunisphaera limnophila]